MTIHPGPSAGRHWRLPGAWNTPRGWELLRAVLPALLAAWMAGYHAQPSFAAPAPAHPPADAGEVEAVQPVSHYRFTAPNRLTSLPSGPGVLIFDPILPADPGQKLRDLTSACGTWLYINVGGQPAFGKTPGWSVPIRLARQAGFEELRPTAAQAAGIARSAGCTHAAVGIVTRAGEKLSLTYQLWDVRPALPKVQGKADSAHRKGRVASRPTSQRVGRPATVSGTASEITAQLPQVARALVRAAGGTPAGIPEVLSLTAEDLVLLGRAARSSKRDLGAEELSRLEAVQEKDPLACAVWLNTRWLRARRPTPPVVRKMVEAAPENAVIWWIAGYSAVGNYRPYVETVRKLAVLYPHNYLFAQAESWSLGEADRSSRAAPLERAVRCAPGNADGWSLLAGSISGVANELRQARLASKVPEKDWPTLERYYDYWMQATLRATRIEPRNGYFWLGVAGAATFSGDSKLARDAFWKAYALSPKADELYSWGLQMFDAKWGGNRAEFEKVAKLAVEASYNSAADMQTASHSLRRAGFPERATALLERAYRTARAEIELDSDDSDAHVDLARIAMEQGKLGEAVESLRVSARIQPDRADLHWELGLRLYDHRNYPEAEREFREVVNIAPEHSNGYRGLAMTQIYLGRPAEAEKSARQAHRLGPSFALNAYWLGEALFQQGRKEEALTHFEEAGRLSQNIPALNQRLCLLLTEKGRLDEAIAAGERAVRRSPKSVNAQSLLLRALLKKGDSEPALAAARAALEVDPKNPAYHLLLGNALLLAGRREEALVEWKVVLDLSGSQNTPETQEARQQIEKHR